MTSRIALGGFFFLVALATINFAAEDPKVSPGDPSKDYSEFSRLLQKLVVAGAPREVKENFNWGQTIPIPEKLRLPGLRVRIKVGDHEELPHGLWKRMRVWLEDPVKDVQIQVKDFKKNADNIYRLSLDAQALIHGQAEINQWQKGLSLVNGMVQVDATLGMSMDCDVAVSLQTKVFPPELKIEPRVAQCKLILKDFNLKDVSFRRLGKVLEGEKAREVGNELKGFLQGLLTQHEAEVKEQVNQAIAQSIREGKGTISAVTLLQLLNASGEKK